MPVIEAWRRRRRRPRSSAERRSGPGGGGARGARARRARHAARPGLGSCRLRDRAGARESGARPELVLCASPETARRAEAAGLRVVEPDEAPELDLALDGADEVMRDLAVLKGGGGALLREKLVFECATRCVIVAEARKLVGRAGRGLAAAGRGRALRLGGHARAAARACSTSRAAPQRDDGTPFVTDEGHHILDCAIRAESDLRALAAAIKAMTGVVEHGLFLEHADVGAAGRSRRLARAAGQAVNCTGCRRRCAGRSAP